MNLIEKVRRNIAAAMTGKTVEEMESELLKANVAASVDKFLMPNPDWKSSQQSSHQAAPAAAPDKDSKQKAKHKAKRIMKTLGAGAGTFTPHIVDEAALERARAKCREIVTADPAAYSFIIESAPIKGTND